MEKWAEGPGKRIDFGRKSFLGVFGKKYSEARVVREAIDAGSEGLALVLYALCTWKILMPGRKPLPKLVSGNRNDFHPCPNLGHNGK